MPFLLWGALLLAAILAVVVVVLLVRRRRARSADSAVFPPATADEGGFQVRLLEDQGVARQARLDALRGEVQALRREASYASQRGLDRRAERLQALIVEREEELRRHEGAESDQGR